MRERPHEQTEFGRFVGEVETRLRHALVATYGPVDGREATVDALSWAWEHWDRLAGVDNRLAYLYRVGQSSTRRFAVRPLPPGTTPAAPALPPEFDPGLIPALGRLSVQQRTVVVLVHAFAWSQTEVAELLEINVSTVREHLARAMARLRSALEVSDAR